LALALQFVYDQGIFVVKSNFNNWLSTYLNRRMLVVFMLGFSSGLPLALIGGTLQAWFKTAGASMILIGFSTLIGQPYSYKFLWAPLLDKYAPTSLVDRRRSWMVIMQLLIIGAIIAMAMFNPQAMVQIFKWNIPVLFLLGLFLSTCSATQDIAIDAYRIEILKHDERGLGAALGIEGYRLAMIASGGFALILADKIGWQSTYLWMAGLMLIGVLATAIAPSAQQAEKSVGSLPALIAVSFKDFLLREKAWLILLLIILYKLGDAFSHALSSTFLLDLNFTLTEVGMINKVLGVVATLIGVFVGGLFMTRVGLYRALLYFGILAAITNLTYMVLALVGKNFEIACGAVFIENICAGMGTAALVALIMSLCNKNYTATQYALFSALTALGRIYVGPISGYMVENFGWTIFYGFSAAVAIPGLLLLIYLRKQIERRDVDSAAEQPVVESSTRVDTFVNEASQFRSAKA
jgi:PAT family beta-lactamase induction signal transducer AmpG